MDDILKLLLEQIKELEEERNATIDEKSENPEDGESEENINFAQFVNSKIGDNQFKKLIFKSQLSLSLKNEIVMFYFKRRLYLTFKKYHVGLFFDIDLLPRESINEMDEAITYIFTVAKPSTRFGTPRLTQQQAVEAIGRLIDKYLYNKVKYEPFILEDFADFNYLNLF